MVMDRSYVIIPLWLVLVLFAACICRTTEDKSAKVHLGHSQLGASNTNGTHETSTLNAYKGVTQTSRSDSYVKQSTQSLVAESLSIYREYSETKTTEGLTRELALLTNAVPSKVTVSAELSKRTVATHSNDASSSEYSNIQSMHSVQPSSASVLPRRSTSFSDWYSTYTISTMSQVPSSNLITSSTTLKNSTSSVPANSTMISKSSLNPQSASKFENVTLATLHSAINSTHSIPITASSLQNSSSFTTNAETSMLPITEQASSISSHQSKSTTIHWKTVTICPWDTMYTAAILPSSSVMSSSVKSSSLVTSSSSAMMSSVLNTTAIETLSASTVAPSSSWIIHPATLFSVVSNQSDIQPIAKKGCNVVLDGLAKVMGEMTSCLIRHLRPIEVCGKCTKFHSYLRRYETLIHKTKNCENELILDYNAQYQAVTKMYKVQYNMWQDFECEKCYRDRTDTDPNALWIPKEEFLKSQSLVREIMVCFANYTKSEVRLPYPVMLNVSDNRNGSSWKSNTMICTKCEDLYRKLKKYMKSIHFEGSAEKRWCADMVYGFNETRRIWGQFCVAKEQDQESIIALTCFFCFLPVVFYVGTKLHSDVKERKNESRVNYDSD